MQSSIARLMINCAAAIAQFHGGRIVLLLDKTEPGKRRECDEEFLQTVSAKLSWPHTVKLMDRLGDGASRLGALGKKGRQCPPTRLPGPLK